MPEIEIMIIQYIAFLNTLFVLVSNLRTQKLFEIVNIPVERNGCATLSCLLKVVLFCYVTVCAS